MKKIVLIIILITFTNCKSIYRKMFSVVSNKFSESTENVGKFESWNDKNLYVLRVEVKLESKITYKKNNEEVIEISDYPLKSYRFIISPIKRKENHEIVEELYLYLNNFDTGVKKGKALYMSSIPLKKRMTKLIYNNDYFISTSGVNHLMTGKWKKEGDMITLNLTDKKNNLTLIGKEVKVDKTPTIEFTKVNHPKPLNKNDKRFIDISDVLQVNSIKENGEMSDVKGIRFLQNNRTFVHPDWSKLDKYFKYSKDSAYYKNNYEKRQITDLYIGDDNCFYFKIFDKDVNGEKQMFTYTK